MAQNKDIKKKQPKSKMLQAKKLISFDIFEAKELLFMLTGMKWTLQGRLFFERLEKFVLENRTNGHN